MNAPVIMPKAFDHRFVLGMRVDHIEFAAAADRIVEWAQASSDLGRYVCAANVHMTMEAHDDVAYRSVVNCADLVLPDGVPLVWALRAFGLPQSRRVRVTPDLLLVLFAACEVRGLKVGLYGGTPDILAAFVSFLKTATPDLELVFSHSPPFRPLTPSEDREITDASTPPVRSSCWWDSAVPSRSVGWRTTQVV